jgi:DNA polymerase-1
MDALYLVDGSNLIFRAYHALPPLNTKAGVPTGAVYGFTQMLIKLEQDHHPSHLAVVFDAAKGRSFREELYGDYKANRSEAPNELVPQFALVRSVVDAMAVPRIELPTCEADDVIAALTRRAREADLAVVIVSSDKDLMQLIDDHVCMIDTMPRGRGEREKRYGAAEVAEKFGVPPSQLGDVLALMGDSIDNVPGVPGVGEKTAAALVQHFGSLDELLGRVDEVTAVPGLRGAAKVQAAIRAHLDAVRISRRLVSLDDRVEVPLELAALRRREPDMERVAGLFRELEFERLLERLAPKGSSTGPATGPAAAPTTGPTTGSTTGPTNEPAAAAPAATAAIALSEEPVRVIGSTESLEQLVGELRAAGEIGLALETATGGPFAAMCGIGFAAAGLTPTYLPLGHRYIGAPAQVPLEAALAALRPLVGDAAIAKHVHAHKQALLALAGLGLPLAGVVGDPELAAYLLDPNLPHDLASLAARYGATVEERESLCGAGKKATLYEGIEVARAAGYAARRAEATLAVSRALRADVERAGMARLLDEVELPLARVLATIERHGVKLDSAHLAVVGEKIAVELAGIEEEVRRLIGYPVNLGSPKQLQELLFDKLQLPPGKKTKTGYSTDAEVLEELAPLHPIAARIHEHRMLAKLKGTYVDTLPHLVDAKSGRLHTSYNQTVAATGRISSSDPNLQNIPIRSEVGREIRRAFVADAGNLLIAADYSQIELRVLAHLSRDAVLLDAFTRGEDVHTRTAREVFGVADEAVTAEHRRVAKAINYGLAYGQTDYGLSRVLGIHRAEAAKYIADYFARYTGVADYMRRLVDEARREGGARTVLDRFRPLPDLKSQNRQLRQYAERMARNTPIQGSAADILKLAMIAVQQRLETEAKDARMLLTVHDELVLEAPRDQAERVARLVCETMESVWQRDPPMKVEFGIGPNWAEC